MINTSTITIDELIKLEPNIEFNKFCQYIEKYLTNRISKKDYLNDSEIDKLEKIIQIIKSDINISCKFKNTIYKKAITLIVISKNCNNEVFTTNILNFNNLSLDELYLYLETIIKYGYFCLTEELLKKIIMRFKSNREYLIKVKKILIDNKTKLPSKKTIDVIDKKISLLLLLEDDLKIIPTENITSFNLSNDLLPIKNGKNIITIDKPISPDLDGAFSVEKNDDLYFLEVYITDVPSFLLRNEDVLKEAFNRGVSMYNNQNADKLFIRDMIPPVLSHNYLSLRKNQLRNVITFSYCIDKKGNIYLQNVSRNLAFINDNIDPQNVEKMLQSDLDSCRTQRDLRLYKDLCNLVCQNTNKPLLSRLKISKISDIIGFPSILTNYHVGYNSNLVIYREKGKYVKNSKEFYAHSVTPLRKFVSDINLTIYLNQLGIIKCPDKYIYYVEDNMDYIIEHLNEQEKLSYEFAKRYSLVKKYYE